MQLSSQSDLSALTESLEEALWAVDAHFNLLNFNKAFEQLYESVCGAIPQRNKTTEQLVSTKHQLLLMTLYQRALKGEKFSAEIPFQVGGKESTYEILLSPIPSTNKSFLGVACSARNINERKKVEADLLKAKDAAEAASHAKSDFLANMSHELRTPLNAIIGYSEMLQEESRGLQMDEITADLEKIRSAGNLLLGLINDILDLSKIEAGKMDFCYENVDIPQLLGELSLTIQPSLLKRDNVLKFITPPNLGAIEIDKTKVRQILINLLSNACKFTKNGEITVSAEKIVENGQEKIVFKVSDTGVGMSPEQLEKVFQAFTQADSLVTRNFGGTGLGLAISKQFCFMMGGSISVQSSLGKGSTFTVQLPTAPVSTTILPVHNPLKKAIKFPKEIKKKSSNKNITVLVLDDDPIVYDRLNNNKELVAEVRKLIQEALEEACEEVKIAGYPSSGRLT